MVDMSIVELKNQKLHSEERKFPWKVLGWVVTGALLISLTLVYCWNQQQIIAAGYQIEELREANRKMLERQWSLRAEYQTLTRAERLDRKAEELGLVSPNQPEVTIIEAGTPIGQSQDLLASAQIAGLINQ